MVTILNNHNQNTRAAFKNINSRAKEMIHLPKTFLGGYPLYYGIEVGLGITIINKFCGMYGILALFSGHALSLMQWIFYLFQFFTLIIYSKALYQLYQPHLVYYSFTLCTFACDTALTLFSILFFTAEWYGGNSSLSTSTNSVSTNKNTNSVGVNQRSSDPAALATKKNQAASIGYEYVCTVVFILIGIIGRLYINFMLISFVKTMFQTPKYIIDENDETYDISNNLKNKNIIYQYWYKAQKKCYNFCKKMLQ